MLRNTELPGERLVDRDDPLALVDDERDVLDRLEYRLVAFEFPFAPFVLGDISVGPQPAVVCAIFAGDGCRVALEHPPVGEFDFVSARLCRVVVQFPDLFDERRRVDDHLSRPVQGGAVAHLDNLVGDVPHLDETVIVRDDFIVLVDDENPINHSLLLGSQHRRPDGALAVLGVLCRLRLASSSVLVDSLDDAFGQLPDSRVVAADVVGHPGGDGVCREPFRARGGREKKRELRVVRSDAPEKLDSGPFGELLDRNDTVDV